MIGLMVRANISVDEIVRNLSLRDRKELEIALGINRMNPNAEIIDEVLSFLRKMKGNDIHDFKMKMDKQVKQTLKNYWEIKK